MYIHIGNNRIINDKRIIGIFDLDTTGVSDVTRKFLKQAENDGRIAICDDGLPKSAVLCDDDSLFLTRISSKVIARRQQDMNISES